MGGSSKFKKKIFDLVDKFHRAGEFTQEGFQFYSSWGKQSFDGETVLLKVLFIYLFIFIFYRFY